MDNPKVSIIIATFNAASTLRTALESITTQTYQNWECIVVDGLSHDNTIEIVKEYKGRDQRFRYISESDHGIYDAFNKGWSMAKGTWIHYLGADDWLEKEGMEKLMEAEDPEADILFGCVNINRHDGSLCIIKPGFPKIGNHQGMVMRRSVIETMGGFNGEIYKVIADYDLIVRSLNAGYKMVLCDTNVAHFSIGGYSQSFKNALAYCKDRYTINKKYKGVMHPLIYTLKECSRKYGSIIYRNVLKLFKIYSVW